MKDKNITKKLLKKWVNNNNNDINGQNWHLRSKSCASLTSIKMMEKNLIKNSIFLSRKMGEKP